MTARKTVLSILCALVLVIPAVFSQTAVIGVSAEEEEAEPDADTVTEVQNALNDAGYDCGEADGIFGELTEAAIREYQEDEGLEETGEIDDDLLVSLGLAEEGTKITGTVVEATMNTITVQTEDDETYLCATEDTEFDLSGGITLGMEVEVTLTSEESDEYGLYTAEKVTETGDDTEEDRTATAPDTDLTGTVAEATMNTITLQTDDGETYLIATEDAEFDLSDGITLGMEVEVTLTSDTSDEYGLFTAETVTEIGDEEEAGDEEDRTVVAPSTDLTGTVAEGTMNTITLQTDDGSTYLISREDAELDLPDGLILGMEVEVTLTSDTSDEYGLFTAETITEISSGSEAETEEDGTVTAPSADLTGTVAEATMNTILLQTDDGSEYLIATEDAEFNLSDGLTLGLEVEVTLTSDTSDEYGLFTAETVTEIGDEEEAGDEEDRTVAAPSTDLTGTVAEATMNTILLQTDDGSEYLIATEDAEFDLTDGLTLGLEVEVTLDSDTSDEYGLFTAETVTEIGSADEGEAGTEEDNTVVAPSTDLTGTVAEATMNTILLQTDDGSEYLIATEDTEFDLTDGLTLGLNVEVTLTSDTSDEYGLFTAETVTEIGSDNEGEEEAETEEDRTVAAPGTDLTGTVLDATMNTLTLQTDDGSEYLIATEDTEFDLTDGLTVGLEVEVTLTSDTSDEYGLFTAETVTEIGTEGEAGAADEEEEETEEPAKIDLVTGPGPVILSDEEESGEEEPEETAEDDSDRYNKTIDDYVGKNAATIGYVSVDGEVRDEYGDASIVISFISADGMYLDPENEDQMEGYIVTAQMPEAGSELTVTYQTDEAGEEYDYLTDDLSYDEIVLVAEPIEDNGTGYQAEIPLTEISPSPDKYTKYIADYVGRNLASCGYVTADGELRAETGHATYVLNIITEDGEELDPEDFQTLKQYIVTGQSPVANTENDLVFMTDSDGNEYSTLVDSETVESVDLYVTKLPDEVLAFIPMPLSAEEE